MRGDHFQNGGLLIVKKGGHDVLLSFRQESPADSVSNPDILKALGIGANAELEPDMQSQPL